MANDFDAGAHGAIVAVEFAVANAVTNKTNEDLVVAGGVNTLHIMPNGGSVIGLSVRASADLTAGTVTFRAHLEGTEFAQSGYPAPALSDTVQDSYATIRPGVLTFTAGQGVGVSYTSTTDAAPTDSNDYGALLFCQLDPDN